MQWRVISVVERTCLHTCDVKVFRSPVLLQVAALQESLSADGATSASYSALMKETKSNRKQLDKLLAENRVLGQKVGFCCFSTPTFC